MTEMVDRVALAIEAKLEGVCVDLTRGPRIDVPDLAHAVIEAMREPTEAMWNAPVLADKFVNGVYPSGEESEEIWKAMIDAALNEPTKETK